MTETVRFKGEGCLYMVASPIGNLQDLSFRALAVLAQSNLIAAENPKHSAILLRKYGIATPVTRLNQHNERILAADILSRIEANQKVAYLSDAGTPGFSDPGAYLAERVRQSGYQVLAIPGPNAFVTAISASGIEAQHWFFYGFLPNRSGARRVVLTQIQTQIRLVKTAIGFYEAPHRIQACLQDLGQVFGLEQQVTVCRELSKQFEQIHCASVQAHLKRFCVQRHAQRGEFVVLLPLSISEQPQSSAGHLSPEQLYEILYLHAPMLKAKQMVGIAKAITGEARNALYQRLLSYQDKQGVGMNSSEIE